MKINLLNVGKKMAALVLSSAIIVSSNQILVTKVSAVGEEGAWTDAGNYDTVWYDSRQNEDDIGTEENPYKISTARDLAGLSFIVKSKRDSFKGKIIQLEISKDKPIDMNNHMWTPIGNVENNFEGTFDGKRNTISKLKTDKNKDYQGFFGVNKGIISNIIVADSDIRGEEVVGGIAGFNGGVIENSYNAGIVTAGYSRIDFIVHNGHSIGGVAGDNNGTIKNCYNIGDVTGCGERVAGVAGYNRGIIENSYNTGVVRGIDGVGGVAGYNRGIIENSYNTGDVKGQQRVGGVAGWNNGEMIKNSYNTGDVTGKQWVGGVAGDGSRTIENCYYCNDAYKIPNGGNNIGLGKTLDEMKDIKNLPGLEQAFVNSPDQDDKEYGIEINCGFPVLKIFKESLINEAKMFNSEWYYAKLIKLPEVMKKNKSRRDNIRKMLNIKSKDRLVVENVELFKKKLEADDKGIQ